jgi:L-serine dehydratase
MVYYSTGGGFVVEEASFGLPAPVNVNVPFSFDSAADLLRLCHQHGLSITEVMIQNELAIHSARDLKAHIKKIWAVTQDTTRRGLVTDTILPGPLKIPRRAPSLYRTLLNQQKPENDILLSMDWLNLFALAVSEENAAGGRVVTSPTNGACGVLPAVINWYNKFICPIDDDILTTWFLTATAIGGLFKKNASISGAEVGCQGEIGVACSMAAAGLAALMDGSPKEVCIAAEIAMEHNLGLTCDPIAGQVQIPCIERNAIAAVKAVNAARMALRRASVPCVSLDAIIETMYRTGKDMPVGYRETSLAGLAITVRVLP